MIDPSPSCPTYTAGHANAVQIRSKGGMPLRQAPGTEPVLVSVHWEQRGKQSFWRKSANTITMILLLPYLT